MSHREAENGLSNTDLRLKVEGKNTPVTTKAAKNPKFPFKESIETVKPFGDIEKAIQGSNLAISAPKTKKGKASKSRLDKAEASDSRHNLLDVSMI